MILNLGDLKNYSLILIVVISLVNGYILRPKESILFTGIIGIILSISNYFLDFLSISPVFPFIFSVIISYVLSSNVTLNIDNIINIERLKNYENLNYEGILKIDKRFCIVDCNEKLCDIFKYTQEELIGSSILDLIHEDYLVILNKMILGENIYAQDIVGIDRKENELDLIMTYQLKDNFEIIYFIENKKVDFMFNRMKTSIGYYEALSKIPGIGLIERDLTEIYDEFDKLKHEGIVDLPAYFKRHPDELTNIISKDKITYVNNEVVTFYEAADDEELIEFLQGQIIDEEDQKDTIKSLDRLFNDKESFERRLSLITIKGNTKNAILRSNYPSRHNPNFISLIIDITEQYQKDLLIKETQQKYELLFSKAPLGVFTVSNKKIILANQKLAEIFGYDNASNLISMDITEIQPDFLHDEYEFRDENKRKNRLTTDNYKSFGLKKDGRQIPIEVTSTFVAMENEKFELVFIQDISEEVKLEQEKDNALREIMEAKRLESLALMAGGLVHDLNNLLTGINGGIELISVNNRLSEDHQDTISIIKDASEQASNLIRSLMAYTGKEKLFQENINISELINDMKGLIKLSINDNIKISYQLDDELDNIFMSKIQLQQVILNSVINSSDAIDSNRGEIEISTGRKLIDSNFFDDDSIFHGDNVILHKSMYNFLQIKDNGTGIKPGDIKNIFDPFFTTKKSGKGLGLSVVQGIIANQGKGAIQVKSKPNRGTTITYILPIQTNKQNIVRPEIKEIDAMLFIGRALICDDEKIVRDILSKYLKHMGLEVLVTTNGFDAISHFNHDRNIDIVFLDLTMPELNGFEVFQELIKIRDDIPIIIISGYTNIDVSKFLIHSKFEYLNKPFTQQKLLNKVKLFLECQ